MAANGCIFGFSRDKSLRMLFTLLASACMTACSSFGASGPSAGTVRAAAGTNIATGPIKVIDLSSEIASRAKAALQGETFLGVFGEVAPFDATIRPGDVLDVSIWEAAPSVLFGSFNSDSRAVGGASTSMARNASLPDQMVDPAGNVTVPFVGKVAAAGRTGDQVAREIEARLRGKAHQPQAIVRVVRNATAGVTVVGEVANSTRVALSPKGERLLDALASAGGVRQPVGKTTVQLTRGSRVVAMPLEAIIRDPQQNIVMQSDDVLTAYYQPYSFTALGAIGTNAEINFEATGLTLAQALGRIGGLRDERADIRGVFIFRMEVSAIADPSRRGVASAPGAKVPVIYRVNLKDPESFFAAQDFPIRNKDVLYVSNAPAADLQKFVGLVSQVAFSIVGVGNAIN